MFSGDWPISYGFPPNSARCNKKFCCDFPEKLRQILSLFSVDSLLFAVFHSFQHLHNLFDNFFLQRVIHIFHMVFHTWIFYLFSMFFYKLYKFAIFSFCAFPPSQKAPKLYIMFYLQKILRLPRLFFQKWTANEDHPSCAFTKSKVPGFTDAACIGSLCIF